MASEVKTNKVSPATSTTVTMAAVTSLEGKCQAVKAKYPK